MRNNHRILRLVLLALLLALVGVFSASGQAAEGVLAVSDVLPGRDTSEVAAGSTITVIFNRPVVPLGLTSDTGLNLPDPLRFDPAVEGMGEWINTFIYQFTPTPTLAGGTTYTVTVDPDLTAVDGARLDAPFIWTFTTIAPRITEIVPSDGVDDARLDQTIQVRFNQPMDRASTEISFQLRAAGGGSQVPGDFEWADDNAGFRFTPRAPLTLGTRYAVQFSSIDGLPQSAAGGAELIGQTETFFETVPLPAIINTSPTDGEQSAYPYGGFTIYFASPMEIDSIRERVVIDPPPYRDDYDTYYSEWEDSYTLAFPTEPSTAYTVTLLPGMRDLYGNTIGTTTTVSYMTTEYDSELIMETQGDFGFYNANNPDTRLFIKHRNVSRVDLTLHQLSPTALLGTLVSSTRYNDRLSANFSLTEQTQIKRWTIPSVAPLNVLRYEYLSLGDAGGVAVCDGAPLSRVGVGDQIAVITQPDTLNIRAEPLTGSILAKVARGYSAPVIAGPVCAGDYTWWQVQTADGAGWLAEGDQVEYYIEVTARAATTSVEVTDADGGALPAGVYFLNVTAPEITYPREHVLIVGDANLTMKTAIDSVTVWATDISSGQPIAGAPIQIYDISLNVIGEGTTDADGLVRFETVRRANAYETVLALLQSETHFGIAASEWSSGIEGYQFNLSTDYYPQPYSAYVYTDRPIYRPDQPVYFRGVIRAKDDMNYSAPDFSELPARVYDPEGNIVWEDTLTLNAAGSFSGQFDIAPDAPLGFYLLDAILPGEDPDDYWTRIGSVDFGVAEYRLPEFQVTVTPDESEIVAGDTIRAVVDSRYYFGGAVSEAKVAYSVRTEPFFFAAYTGPGNYSFVDYDADGSPGDYYGSSYETVSSGELTTDARGLAVIELPADLGDSTVSKIFTIEASVTDESGQAVTGRASLTVHGADVYIGVAPEEYVGLAGEPNTFNVIAVDWQGAAVAGQAIDLTFVERRWSSTQEQDANGRTTWTYDVEEIPVSSATVTTDSDGRASAQFTPPNGGIFKIKASARDSAGRTATSAATTWVSSRDYVAWRMQNSNRIDLISDKSEYLIGETAEILIASPFQGAAEALVTIERGDVLFSERITLESNSTVYRVPIAPGYAPNIAVTVFIVKGVDANNPVAAFRVGMIGLNVETARRTLDVAIAADKETAGPGDTITYTITTTDYTGAPVPAEVGIALTDLASLSIASPNQVDLLAFFFSKQGLGVRTSSILTINVDQLTQEVLDTIKGGGGGFGEGGIFDVREDFVDTAYWNASVITGADGIATVSVTLPDNLTTWRLDARAVSLPDAGEMRVGDATRDLISTKPLLIRPVTPRFFVDGDQVTLAAIVNNNTDSDLDVDVALTSETGALMFDETTDTQRVTIAAGTRQRVEFPVTIDAPEGVTGIDLLFTAVDTSGAYNDASRPPISQGAPIPLLRYVVPETVGTAGVIDAAGGTRTEGIVLPTDLPIDEGAVEVEIESSLAASTLDALDVLRNFPQQCIEQTISRFLPNILTVRALQGAGIDDPGLRASLDAAVGQALQQLYAQQKSDGGWGWYVTDPSNPLVTAYAVIGLAEARDAGYAVTDSVIERARRFLVDSYITPDLSRPTWELNRQVFILYALARAGVPEPSRTANMFEVRERLSIYARGFLALTYAEIDPTDSRASVLLSDLLNSATLSATGAHWSESERDYWNWNTDTRTTAIALAAFVRLNPENDLIPNIVRYLVSQRTADAWETTQETAWVVMALTDYMVASDDLNPAYTFDAALNGTSLVGADVTPADNRTGYDARVEIADLLRDAVNELAITRTAGAGNLYYRAFLRASLPVDQVQAVEDSGIIIQRRYVLDGETVTGAAVGETVQVRLTIIAPSDLHYVLIQDPIPAGTDAVDPMLAISPQIGTETGLASRDGDPLLYGWGSWLFNNVQFRDEQVEINVEYLPAGTYEYVYNVRAGLPGTYQVIPPTAQEFYFPEVYGRGAGTTFTITDAQ